MHSLKDVLGFSGVEITPALVFCVTCCQRFAHRFLCHMSRRLWQHITASLRAGRMDDAAEHKHRLEERQRIESKQRSATKTPWKPKYFIKEVRNVINTVNFSQLKQTEMALHGKIPIQVI